MTMNPRSATVPPRVDPTPIFEHFRGAASTELLLAAVSHLNVFGILDEPKTFEGLRASLGLAQRPAMVLITALRAMGLIGADEHGRLSMTDLAREHLAPGADFDVNGYLGLASDTPGVLAMVRALKANRPVGAEVEDQGAAYIFREGLESAMEREASARHLTMALAGRAKNVAPHLAKVAPLDGAKLLLDVGGGTGIYAIACVQAHPGLRAIVWDRPEVLKVAREMVDLHGVSDRVELVPGDMFADPVPTGADVVLLSNILHDWDVPECRTLVDRLAEALPGRGRLLIHDVFLNDALDGPLSIALYSAYLFNLTEGRAYSAAEYGGWMTEAGLSVGPVAPTLIHCGVLAGTKGA